MFCQSEERMMRTDLFFEVVPLSALAKLIASGEGTTPENKLPLSFPRRRRTKKNQARPKHPSAR
jgi:hypothetical protein